MNDHKNELIKAYNEIIDSNLFGPKGDPNYDNLKRASEAFKSLKKLGGTCDGDEDVIVDYLSNNEYENFLD